MLSMIRILRTGWGEVQHAACFNTFLQPWQSKRSRNSARQESTQHIFSSQWKDIELPNCTLPELILEKSSNWAEKVAIAIQVHETTIKHETYIEVYKLYTNLLRLDREIYECGVSGKYYTYEQLEMYSKRLACSLLKCGLKPAQTVTLFMPNMPEFPICLLGILEAGFTLTTINPIYRAEEIINQMNNSGSRFVIVHYNILDVVLQVKKHMKNQLDIVCINDFDGKTRELPSGVRPFSDLIKSSIDISNLDKEKHKIDINEAIAFLPYSSGTTGLPKGVCLTHKNLTSNIVQMCIKEINPLQETTKTHQDTVIGVLPFFHIYGTQVVLARSLREGAKTVTLPKFDPKQFVNILEKYRDLVLYAVPPIVLFLSSHPSITSKTLENLRFTGSGGAPCGSTDIEKLLLKRDHNIVQAYGMTEASPVLTHCMPDSLCKASVGGCVPNTFAKTVDMVNSDKTLGPGETGELCFKGPQVMTGYFNQPEATAETIDKDGWLHTGDIGYINEKGHCFIVDRKKELIKVKGFQVAPAELEAVLRQHPSLCDAGVTALPCSKAGEVPVAFVVVKQGDKQPKIDSIKDFVADKVAPYKQIKHVIFTDAIPKNASGKILRRQLKELIKTEFKIDEN